MTSIPLPLLCLHPNRVVTASCSLPATSPFLDGPLPATTHPGALPLRAERCQAVWGAGWMTMDPGARSALPVDTR
uniref:Uncharacterized protein n=1 Tax=Setaria italica TaxID=4555 RepID=K3XNY6_SETIT